MGPRVADESRVNDLLARIRAGDRAARPELFAELYDLLRVTAEARMRGQRRSHTLQPTALVNETFLKLMTQSGAWTSRTHFLASAAKAMRWILTDHARTRIRTRRTARGTRSRLSEVVDQGPLATVDLVAMDEALRRMAAVEPDAVRIVELRVFCNLRLPDAARAAGIPLRTAERLWNLAKLWLRSALG